MIRLILGPSLPVSFVGGCIKRQLSSTVRALASRSNQRNHDKIIQQKSNRFSSTEAGSEQKQNGIMEFKPQQFISYLQKHNIHRCFMVHDHVKGLPIVSHPELQEIADYFGNDHYDYREHEGVFMELGKRTGCLLGAFVWNTNRGQACGGIRLWEYKNMEDYLKDGLRLALGMGIKSALAGLWAGGGKGVIAAPSDKSHIDPDFRQKMLYDYGDFLTSLNGCYIAAEDIGMNVADLNNVHHRTRYTTCISEDLGGSGNPSVATGKGVVAAMEGALDFMNLGDLEGKMIAIQGAGNVACVMIETLLKKGVKHIHVTDCNMLRVQDATDSFKDLAGGRLTVQKVPLDDLSVLSYPCDILSPCALGNVLTQETIPKIQAKIVCGAANNQLGCDDDNELLKDMGITYIVDFLANRMGIVNCANEAFGRLPDDPAIIRHFDHLWENSLFVMTKKMLQQASDENVTPATAAMEIAEKLSRELHPIWPGRSQSIIKSLVESGWHNGNDFWQ